MFLNIIIIIITSAIIYWTGKYFTVASSAIGDHFKLSRSVKGATLDAISSSFPELMIALFSVMNFGQFEVGLSTIIGSALFNLLVITGISVLLAPSIGQIKAEIVFRDTMFYLFSVFLLLAALIFSSTWYLYMPIIGLTVYGLYIFAIAKDTKAYRQSLKLIKEIVSPAEPQKSLGTNIFIMVSSMVIIAIATFYLTEHALLLAKTLNIPPIIIAFTVLAIATSFPDGVISWINAKNGNHDDAIANAIGSNVFDILVALSLPLIIAISLNGPIPIGFKSLDSIMFLMGSTILTFYFMAQKSNLSKREAIFMIALYVAFIGYIILQA